MVELFGLGRSLKECIPGTLDNYCSCGHRAGMWGRTGHIGRCWVGYGTRSNRCRWHGDCNGAGIRYVVGRWTALLGLAIVVVGMVVAFVDFAVVDAGSVVGVVDLAVVGAGSVVAVVDFAVVAGSAVAIVDPVVVDVGVGEYSHV